MDFRQELYRRYVSTFKVAQRYTSDDELQPYWDWCDRRFLPLLVQLDHTAAVLELGCGAGNMLVYLKRRGFLSVYGIDISAEQVRLAGKRGLQVEVAGAVEYLDTRYNQYDLIIALDFIEHFSKDELIPLFQSINRALKNEGRLILQTPNGDGLSPNRVIYGDLTHMTIFNPSSLGQILRLVGFNEIRFFETGPAPKNFVGAVRLILWTVVKLGAKLAKMIETGSAPQVWTETLICSCKKVTV